MSTLLLVRHGPSAYIAPPRALDRREVEQWRTDYDTAGLRSGSTPPTALVAQARNADVLVSSDMIRARDSADRLAHGRPVVSTPLLRETPLPIPPWPTRLPLGVWGALIYLSWKAGSPLGDALDAAEHTRVTEAAAYMGEMLTPGATALAVTHGIFRALLAEELKRTGWRERERRGGYSHWSAWVFNRHSRG